MAAAGRDGVIKIAVGIQTQMRLWQVDPTLAAGYKAATLWQTGSSAHAMALTAVDNLDLKESGMGMYPLSAKRF
jgi:hypothetical protein